MSDDSPNRYTRGMQVDRGGYLVFVTSIALGGAAGYIASEKNLVPHMKKPEAPRPEPPAPVVVDAGPPVPVAVVVDAGPTCDDSIVEEVECPPIGLPTIEGGCGPFPQSRCNDFKRTMKPREAALAVKCLNKLNGIERCDAKRVDLCAHQALMTSCPDAVPACDAIAKTCASASRRECNEALAGLKEVGRESAVACIAKHCADKGIVGCEAAPP